MGPGPESKGRTNDIRVRAAPFMMSRRILNPGSKFHFENHSPRVGSHPGPKVPCSSPTSISNLTLPESGSNVSLMASPSKSIPIDNGSNLKATGISPFEARGILPRACVGWLNASCSSSCASVNGTGTTVSVRGGSCSITSGRRRRTITGASRARKVLRCRAPATSLPSTGRGTLPPLHPAQREDLVL